MRQALSALAAAGLPFAAAAVEEPDHEVIVEDGNFEVRLYEPIITASVDVRGEKGAAANAAFNPLFRYISGNNTAKAKIDMTAPVTQAASSRIDMTAPVTQTETGKGVWRVSFVMPEEWTMETLPAPDDSRVMLAETPARTLATIRFSGRARPKAQAEKTAALETWIAERGYEITGPAVTAFYNAPFVPGPFRRNEIMIPVRLPD